MACINNDWNQMAIPEVAALVGTALKKEGRFDEIRRNIMEEMRLDGSVDQLQAVLRSEVRKILDGTSPSLPKDQIRRLVRDNIRNNAIFQTRINALAQGKTKEQHLEAELRTEIDGRVRAELGLPPIDRSGESSRPSSGFDMDISDGDDSPPNEEPLSDNPLPNSPSQYSPKGTPNTLPNTDHDESFISVD